MTTDAPPWQRPQQKKFPGIPAWGMPTSSTPLEDFDISLMQDVTPEWAWGGSDGSGVRVCVVDTGVDADHPRVGGLERSASVVADENDEVHVEEGDFGDLAGHGTACAGVIRSIAPGASLSSVRVLTRGKYGSGKALMAGLEWAIDQGFEVINLSLATTSPALEPQLRELADRAYFKRSALVVSAHNMPVHSFPWTFSSVISVASHNEPDSSLYYYNAAPPVDFYARGVKVSVPWVGGTEKISTGNSFAAPHLAGVCARVLGKHPWLTPFQLKTVLYLAAKNVAGMSESKRADQERREEPHVVHVGQ
ncbi:S8 family serine peptidase [Streptacidiphilus rugosus]|uniref:S8 family serine peptidase n=1 Tax=Streptacidiphilus rugosus TaxID=405783 RepID=UPI000A87E96C|nr:S8 family serine peptidase [Streptacidiphilus rugosus]